ncbi:uncharacterized protein LOC114164360 isoform X1 [Vigna unguiculata]|uniref:Uncharacterized protein n=1 Tax=Vigna unguiculata TaxID=3917 RepID=A0A4D6NIP1_VIGUN|nr:uncharacterized protein LOC114164360 isoform X1 [Vigna unguiculata]QCE13526.1 hypothetical protein DEO72_LG11g519 [Vigna unguiculata]
MTQIKSTHETTNPLSVNENGEPNFPERSKHSEDENRESDGLRSGIDEKTSMDDVRAPNVFERAKEEFQALSEVFHHKRKVSASDIRDENQMAESSKHNQEATTSPSDNFLLAANIFVKAKEEIKGMIHHDKSKHHHKETHGRNDDITENTPLDEIKGPNVFERVKEEFEAVFQAIHPK